MSHTRTHPGERIPHGGARAPLSPQPVPAIARGPRQGLPASRLSGRSGCSPHACRAAPALPWPPAGGGERGPLGGAILEWRRAAAADPCPVPRSGSLPVAPPPPRPFRSRQHECGGARPRDGGGRAALERAAAQRAAPHHERQQPVSAPPAGGARGVRGAGPVLGCPCPCPCPFPCSFPFPYPFPCPSPCPCPYPILCPCPCRGWSPPLFEYQHQHPFGCPLQHGCSGREL